jgi:cation:H+ antiporter
VDLLLVAIGVLLLYTGGEALVRGAVRLASRLGVSSMVVGLTVVAFGTSAPELAATLASALRGAPGLAVGNVLGSNVANVGLILAVTASVYPLVGERTFVRREVPLMVAICALLIPVMLGGSVGRVEGALLLTVLALYLWRLLRRGEVPTGDADPPGTVPVPLWRSVALVVVGVALLVVGARALVQGAVAIAEGLGVPDRVIGLTLVAFGTSLPELASSLVAAVRRETDIILGNIVGSNVFNVLAVLGATALVQPVPVAIADVGLDLVIVLLFGAALLPFMWRRGRLGRRGGLLLLTAYLAYVVFLFV